MSITFKEIVEKKNVAVHCDTLEKAKKLLLAAHEANFVWYDAKSCIDFTDYDLYGSDTCYRFSETEEEIDRRRYENENFNFKNVNGIIYFDEISYYLEIIEYPVVEFDDIEFENKTIEAHKDKLPEEKCVLEKLSDEELVKKVDELEKASLSDIETVLEVYKEIVRRFKVVTEYWAKQNKFA